MPVSDERKENNPTFGPSLVFLKAIRIGFGIPSQPGPSHCAIKWIVIYPVDSVIHLLNNWGDGMYSLPLSEHSNCEFSLAVIIVNIFKINVIYINTTKNEIKVSKEIFLVAAPFTSLLDVSDFFFGYSLHTNRDFRLLHCSLSPFYILDFLITSVIFAKKVITKMNNSIPMK